MTAKKTAADGAKIVPSAAKMPQNTADGTNSYPIGSIGGSEDRSLEVDLIFERSCQLEAGGETSKYEGPTTQGIAATVVEAKGAVGRRAGREERCDDREAPARL